MSFLSLEADADIIAGKETNISWKVGFLVSTFWIVLLRIMAWMKLFGTPEIELREIVGRDVGRNIEK